MNKIFSIFIFFFFAINSVSASVIPDGKCAIITGASKSKKDVLKALKKYSNYVDPIAVESNNGYFAFSLGIYEKSESKSVLNEFKGKGLIPKDSYCGNVKRFIAILYPNKDYTALTDQPSNQNDSTELVDNSSSTSLEVSNLKTENQNLKLKVNSLINENNKMKESIVLLKKENSEIKEEYSKLTKNTDTNNNTNTETVTQSSKQNNQKFNIPMEKVEGIINFWGLDFSMSRSEMNSFLENKGCKYEDVTRDLERSLIDTSISYRLINGTYNCTGETNIIPYITNQNDILPMLKQYEWWSSSYESYKMQMTQRMRQGDFKKAVENYYNSEVDIISFHCKTFNGCDTYFTDMVKALTKKYEVSMDKFKSDYVVLNDLLYRGNSFLNPNEELLCGIGKNGDEICVLPKEDGKTNYVLLYRGSFGKKKLDF